MITIIAQSRLLSELSSTGKQVKYSFGRELPTFGVSANYLGIKVPELDNFSLSKNAFILPFSVNYEADFLLKNRDKTKSQKKVYEVSKFNEKAIYLALLADVAIVYTLLHPNSHHTFVTKSLIFLN